jgi:hypothetical protein
VESFNILNHQNVTSVNTTAYTMSTVVGATPARSVNYISGNTANGAFGATTNSNNNNIYTPRQIQLGARLHF